MAGGSWQYSGLSGHHRRILPVNVLSPLDEDEVHVQMTLTTPGCPVAQTFPGTVEQAVNQLEEVTDCTVELVWDPPWTQDRMSEAARLELGIFY